jgi:hypothetical protein
LNQANHLRRQEIGGDESTKCEGTRHTGQDKPDFNGRLSQAVQSEPLLRSIDTLQPDAFYIDLDAHAGAVSLSEIAVKGLNFHQPAPCMGCAWHGPRHNQMFQHPKQQGLHGPELALAHDQGDPLGVRPASNRRRRVRNGQLL